MSTSTAPLAFIQEHGPQLENTLAQAGADAEWIVQAIEKGWIEHRGGFWELIDAGKTALEADQKAAEPTPDPTPAPEPHQGDQPVEAVSEPVSEPQSDQPTPEPEVTPEPTTTSEPPATDAQTETVPEVVESTPSPAPPAVSNSLDPVWTPQTDDEVPVGTFCQVIWGPYKGRYGVLQSYGDLDENGRPITAAVRTRDDKDEGINVNYNDLRPDVAGKR